MFGAPCDGNATILMWRHQPVGFGGLLEVNALDGYVRFRNDALQERMALDSRGEVAAPGVFEDVACALGQRVAGFDAVADLGGRGRVEEIRDLEEGTEHTGYWRAEIRSRTSSDV